MLRSLRRVEAGQVVGSRGAVTVTSLVIAALVFVAAALCAALIAWCLRPPARDPFFIPFGEVPAVPGLLTRGSASGIGDLADPTKQHIDHEGE